MHFSGKPSGKPSNYIELPVDISRVCSPTCHCRVTLIKDTLLDHAKEHHDFNVCYVAFAIHSKVDLYTIKRYIEHYPKEKVAEEFNMPVVSSWNLPTFPILFYAVAQKDPQLVRYLCAAGADFNKRAEPMGLTLLAYTVISAEYEITDNTDVLATLLTLGANPQDIPEVLWEDYLESPSRQAQKISLSAQEEARVVKELNAAICRNLTLMQRYYLNKATTLFKPTPRMKEVAEAHKFQPLFETQFHIIGQTLSTGRMLNTILSHFIYDSDKPRVLLLTGMSGHGKTEIAKRMGDLLHLEFYRVDMTKMSEETDMFGPNAPYHGYEKGSVLNNFLTSHDNERCVVFLDEFEKTTPEVHQSMLLLLESGHYQDRRHGKNIDCKNIIWILAANLGEEKIQTLFQQYIEDKPPALQMNAPFDQLQHDLEMQFISVIPFFPFEKGEQAVATYKFMRQLRHLVRSPISVEDKKFARHSYLNFQNDAAIALHLANKVYSPELGARSLEKAVNHDIRAKLAYRQLEEGEEWTDKMNEGALDAFDVKLVSGGLGEGNEVVDVVRSGTREMLSKKKETETEMVNGDSKALVKVEKSDEEEL